MQIFPYAKIRNRVLAAHLVLDDNVGTFAVVISLDHISQADIVFVMKPENNSDFRVVNIDSTCCHNSISISRCKGNAFFLIDQEKI